MNVFNFARVFWGVLFFGMLTANAQPPDSLWSRTFGGTEFERCNSVQQTSDGGYILGGWTCSFGNSHPKFWLVKTNEDGDSLWSRTYDSGYSYCYAVERTTDNGYILAGHKDYQGWLVKTDENGDSLWCRSLRGSARGVHQTSDGGYILAGYCSLPGHEDTDLWLAKTDANGTQLWDTTFGFENYDEINSVQVTTDGGYILAGTTVPCLPDT
jgi:hypothetical protein